MKTYFCKTNNLQNLYTMGNGARNISIKKRKINYFIFKVIPFIKRMVETKPFVMDKPKSNKVPCGHLLGKGWPLGSRLWYLIVILSLSHWYPGSGVVLACIDSWSLNPFLLSSFKAVLLLWIIYVISVLFLLCFRARLLIDALWSPAGKWLTSWLSFVMSNCEAVTFPLVSCVRCGAWLYRFLIFALFLTSVSDEFALFNWSSVGYIWLTICSNKDYQY